MTTSDLASGFRLGEWEVHPLRDTLVGRTGETHVEPRVMQLLECLAAAGGEVVEREQLLDELWGGRSPTDEPLTRCVATLRKLLGDSAKDPEYIQTIPKRGYRLVKPVEPLARSASLETFETLRFWRRSWAFLAAGAAVLTIAVLLSSPLQWADKKAPAAQAVDATRLQSASDGSAVARTDPEAHRLYQLSGEAFDRKKEPNAGENAADRHAEAIELVMQSIAIDPEFAPAWARLARIQFDRAQWMRDADPSVAYALAQEAANRALAIDPEQSLALTILGHVEQLWGWDSEASAIWYQKAWATSSEKAGLASSISVLFGRVGLATPEFIVSEFEKDPTNPSRVINDAFALRTVGRHEEARDKLEDARRLVPDATRLYAIESLFDYLDGEYEDAIEKSRNVNDSILACALYATGRHDEAMAVLQQIPAEGQHKSYPMAEVYACMGDLDAAFAFLERALDERDQWLRTLRLNLMLGDLHADARWEPLLAKVGISDADAARVQAVFENLQVSRR